MEIEKTRETSWKIQLRKKDDNIEITSVEMSGEVKIIKLALIKKDNSLTIELNREEFFNFLSLISAFKDVVIGEDEITFTESSPSVNDKISDLSTETTSEISNYNSELPPHKTDDKEIEELNPEEWDPW